MAGRTIVLGLDGADWNFLEPWLDAGELPELQRLMETGVSGPLETVFPPSTVPAWLYVYWTKPRSPRHCSLHDACPR